MAKNQGKVKNVLSELLQSGFFKEWKTPSDVIKKLDQRGISLKGRQVGAVFTALTRMCQDSTTGLERDEIPKGEIVGEEKYRFKKVR